MTVERDHARHLAEHDGVVYAFCSIGCRRCRTTLHSANRTAYKMIAQTFDCIRTKLEAGG